MKRLYLALAVLTLSACAAASGYDPKRYENRGDAGAPDPETVALAPTAKKTIPDPRLAPLPPPPPPVEDAGPPPPRPLAAIMRELEPAMRGKDWPKIIASLEEVAGRAKDDKQWVGFAEKGVELAKKEDVGGVRRQCDACHAAKRKTRKSP